MPVFISYTPDDAEIVERIAAYLVRANVHVWIDKWEMRFGDSLLQRIQDAISDASVLLIMLSKKSVNSEWCKKELNAGLMRELEERRVVTIPVLLEDCEIPLFLREKYRADFRGNFDQEIKRLQDSLLQYTDITLNRVQSDKYTIDWAIDHGVSDDMMLINVDSVSFSKDRPYSVYCRIHIFGNEKPTQLYMTARAKNAEYIYINEIVAGLFRISPKADYRILLEDNRPKQITAHTVDPKSGAKFDIEVYARRMGNNNGFDLLFDYRSILELMLEKRQGIIAKKSDH